MIGPELLRPQQLAALLVEALEPAGDARREDAIAGESGVAYGPLPISIPRRS